MDTDTSSKPKATPTVRGDTENPIRSDRHVVSEIETTFRVFTARLPPATSEALRAKLHLSRSELDDRRKQTDFFNALRELR